ncbi:hypothetical protein BJY01DRAFT_212893 [Aspergillus pseudoustus]|uniref:AB hydrolase-1 domain-containing protein n=1 Tax=Aspergillus pseudoustus TaxID=1810923 RepID=A0ABR4K5A9_9EURO
MGSTKRPIIFVGHSLGGAIIEAALIDPKAGNILNSTEAIVFFENPLRGSYKPSWQTTLENFGQGDFENLDTFRAMFVRIAPLFHITTILENTPVASSLESADSEYHTAEHIIGLEADLKSICQFRETDPNWLVILGQLNTIAKEIGILEERNSPTISSGTSFTYEPEDKLSKARALLQKVHYVPYWRL